MQQARQQECVDAAMRDKQSRRRVVQLEEEVASLQQQLNAAKKSSGGRGRRGGGDGSGGSLLSSLSVSSSSSSGGGAEQARVSTSGYHSWPVGGNVRGVKFEDLELGEQISGGGFCILYKSKWQGMTVAVKRIFDPNITQELRDEFENEVAMLSNMRHPCIVQALCAVYSPPSLCIITEFLDRGSLYHVLHNSTVSLTPERVSRVASQICLALAHVHSNRIVHRDIKSHNILADEFLRVKLCDFGLARTDAYLARRDAEQQQRHTPCGTPAYMAPELWSGAMPTAAADVYAFGVLLNEICSRDVPLEGVDVSAMGARVRTGTRPDVSGDVSPSYRSLIAKCWHQDAGTRPTMTQAYDSIQRMR